jgi:hypothetical protein
MNVKYGKQQWFGLTRVTCVKQKRKYGPAASDRAAQRDSGVTLHERVNSFSVEVSKPALLLMNEVNLKWVLITVDTMLRR